MLPRMTSDTHFNPADLDGEGGTYWDHARREYLAGVKATTICQRYGMSLSSFRMHARAGGWRRVDQPVCEVPPEFGEYHPDDSVSFAELADQAFLNIRRALGSGRAAEASTWMRVYDSLADRARSRGHGRPARHRAAAAGVQTRAAEAGGDRG